MRSLAFPLVDQSASEPFYAKSFRPLMTWGHTRRGPYLFEGEFNPVFLERDKSTIQRGYRTYDTPEEYLLLAS